MAALAPGDRVGRYEVEALVGRGGMGSVYRARDTLLRRKVALKLVEAPDPGDEPLGPDKAGARRILREARMAAALDHPNVVALFDVGEHDGTAFIVMEYVEGRSLRAVLQGDVPLERRLGWAVDVARALAAAHKAGLVHRDVKLDNVMLRDDGVIKVLDFGIAAPPRPERGPGSWRAAPAVPDDEATFATVERGEIAGTPGYIAPEVFVDGVFDARTDQFAWGVLAFRLLARRHPWGAHPDAASLLVEMASRDADPLDAAAPFVPPPVAAVVARALERAPTERFASMAEILDALTPRDPATPTSLAALRASLDAAAPAMEATVPLTTTPARDAATAGATAPITPEATVPMVTAPRAAVRSGAPPAPRTTTAPVRTRRRLVFALIALGSLALGGAAAFGIWRRPPPHLELGGLRRLAFGATYSEYPSLSADGAVLVYDAADAAGDQLYRIDLRTMQRTRLTSGDAWSYAAAVSPDGRRVAYLSQGQDESVVEVLDLAPGARPRPLSRGSTHPRWSRDGKAIWAGTSKRPARFDATTFAETRALDIPPGTWADEILELADGRAVAVAHTGVSLEGIGILVYARGAGEPRWLYRGAIGPAIERASGDRGMWVARQTVADVSEVLYLPLDGSPPSRAGDSDLAPSAGFSISADGRRVAWSTASSKSALLALNEAAPGATELATKVIFEGRHWADTQVRALPDGSGLLFASHRGPSPGLWLETPGEVPRAIAPGITVDSAPAVSADGKRVAIGRVGGGISVAPLGGGAVLELTRDPNDAGPTFARDGRRIYFERRAGVDARSIRCVPVDGGPDEVVLAENAVAPEASPTEDILFYLEPTQQGANTPRVLDLASGKTRPLADNPPARYMALRSSPDGRRVAAYSANGVTEFDVDSGAALHHFESGVSNITGATYTRDGLLVTEERWDGEVWIADLEVR